MDQETKKNYIEMIEKLNSKLSLSENLKEFVNTYDGTNEEETHLMVASAVGALIKYEQAKIKADGYDEVVGANKDFNEWFDGVKNEYKMLEQGIMPTAPPSGTNEEMDMNEEASTSEEQHDAAEEHLHED
ncbi:hypothetical protein ACFL0C_01750 [Patescibacteria group bacterium]